jgi:hypothetical protein
VVCKNVMSGSSELIYTLDTTLTIPLRTPRSPLLFQLQLGLAIVLGRVHTVVRVVDKVWPREDMSKCSRVTRVPVRNTLHVLGHLSSSVQRLAFLDFVDHFPHVHFDFAAVLAGAVETH